MEGYAKYIALRPRAERLGEHGLFGDDDAVDLAAVADELDHYTGNVWTHIISLHREDAERLGYNVIGRRTHGKNSKPGDNERQFPNFIQCDALEIREIHSPF